MRGQIDDASPLAILLVSHKSEREFKPEYDGPIDRDALPLDSARPNFWPPWPFSLLTNRAPNPDADVGASPSSSSLHPPAVAWSFTQTTARVCVRNLQELGSQLWFHLPPAAPPLIVYALIPRRQKLLTTAVAKKATSTSAAELLESVMYKTVIPAWSNQLVRNLALTATGLAIMSWAHSELNRERRLTPLPLAQPDMNRAVLPPFLPEQATVFLAVPECDGDDGASATIATAAEGVESVEADLPLRLRRYWQQQFRDKVPRPNAVRTSIAEWKGMRLVRKCERKNARRLAIYEELVELQALKKKSAGRNKRQQSVLGSNRNSKTLPNTSTSMDDANSLGYALVTGASKGIGRAIAVQLSRWEIPLILVARDIDALTDLAYDLTACYGVDCCVLPADLSKPAAAEKIYKTVRGAGLKVDVSCSSHVLPLCRKQIALLTHLALVRHRFWLITQGFHRMESH